MVQGLSPGSLTLKGQGHEEESVLEIGDKREPMEEEESQGHGVSGRPNDMTGAARTTESLEGCPGRDWDLPRWRRH